MGGKMKISCPECFSEYLDQGVDHKIICHNCGGIFVLVRPEKIGVWIVDFN